MWPSFATAVVYCLFILLLPLQFCIIEALESGRSADFRWFHGDSKFHEAFISIECVLAEIFRK